MTQPELFDTSASPAQSRDIAIEQVTRRAEAFTERFVDRACAFVVDYLKTHKETPGELLTAECKVAGIEPHSDKAFGGVYKRLSMRGLIEKCGTVRRGKGHLTTGGNVWKLTDKGRQQAAA